MRPTSPDNQRWGPETADLALQEIRQRAISDLNNRDERLSGGRMNKANKYSPYLEVQNDDGTGSKFVADLTLASIKHTGEDTLLLTQSRWAEFCSKPQDEKPYTERLLQRDRDERLTRMKAAGQKVEKSLAPLAEADLPILPKPKPRIREPAMATVK